jgi:L-threonylcarbamoyladenylate synthase
MQTLSKEELHLRMDEIFEKIKEGKLFIHPTDTIYGLGCDATNSKAVDKIRQVKKRPKDSAVSVIAPSKEWIIENCYVSKEAEKWMKKLPGPYTLILKLKNHKAVADNVHPGLDSVGVRMPDHWIMNFVEGIGVPIVTTSANVSGKSFMTSLEDLDNELSPWIDFTIYEGEKKGKPSTLIDLSKDKIEIKER